MRRIERGLFQNLNIDIERKFCRYIIGDIAGIINAQRRFF